MLGARELNPLATALIVSLQSETPEPFLAAPLIKETALQGGSLLLVTLELSIIAWAKGDLHICDGDLPTARLSPCVIGLFCQSQEP